MKKQGVSAKDVALEAGVSRTTVSFVLNATPGKTIPEETRRKVLAAAERLGYEPDQDAARLAKSSRYTVALAVRHSSSVYSDAYIVRLIEGIAPVLNRRRCQLVLLPCGPACGGGELVELVRQAGADGVLVTNTLADDAGVPALAAARLPAVVIGTVAGTACQIDIDNRAAAGEATAYLLGLGHTRVAMIPHAPASYSAAQARLDGFREALQQAGLEADSAPVEWADFSEESGRQAMLRLLRRDPRPTAVFAGNDAIAYGAYQAIRELGLSIPRDISIVGFDDDYPSRYILPALSTVTLPASALGERAAELIVDLVEGGRPPEQRIVLATQLSVRASCAAVSSAAISGAADGR